MIVVDEPATVFGVNAYIFAGWTVLASIAVMTVIAVTASYLDFKRNEVEPARKYNEERKKAELHGED